MITLVTDEVISSTVEEIKPKGARFICGLDLGQAFDYSAFSIIEARGEEYSCRHLQRWPVRTPYTDVAAELESDERHILAVDMNGPGRPFIDILSGHELAADVAPVFSHGGDKVVRMATPGACRSAS